MYPLLPTFARPAWNHPAGPKTVFFWAPTIKWCLVGAGLADLARPADKLSVYQVISFFSFLTASQRFFFFFFLLGGGGGIQKIWRVYIWLVHLVFKHWFGDNGEGWGDNQGGWRFFLLSFLDECLSGKFSLFRIWRYLQRVQCGLDIVLWSFQLIFTWQVLISSLHVRAWCNCQELPTIR